MCRIDVVEHSRYIMQVAMRYRKEFPSISLADIVAELNLLVIEMSEKDYDPKYKVITFIENFPAKKIRQVLIYKYVNFTYDDHRNRVFVETCSMNSRVSNDVDSPEYVDSLKLVEADEGNEYSLIVESDINEFEIIDIIEKSNLSLIEKEIMFRRLGLDKFNVMTLEEIGKEFNLTRERIRVIEKGAKEKLKQYCKNHDIYNEREEEPEISLDFE